MRIRLEMKRAKRFFRNHHRLMTFLSLTLLLGTFVVKECLRDDYRDRAAAIQGAAPLFLIREELADIKGNVDGFEQITERLSLAVAPAGNDKMHQLPTKSHREIHKKGQLANLNEPFMHQEREQQAEDPVARAAFHELSTLNKVKSRTWFLVDALPNNEGMEKHLKEIDKEVGAIALRLSGPGDYTGVAMQTHQLHEDLDSMADRVLELADAEYDKAEQRFQLSTRIGYFTYGFGWLLGLLRGVFGAEAPEFE